MKTRFLSLTLALIMLAAFTPPAVASPAGEAKYGGGMRDMTSMEIVWDMGIGINLGNTFEATGSWIRGTTVAQYERAWGSPLITEEIIKGYADAGFGSMRIPVARSNLMGDNYTISAELMDRVEEVVQWVLQNGMYAVINIHWDGGWWYDFPTQTEETMRRYTRFWDQISERFKDYGDMLLFESANEELGWNSLWNPWGSSAGKTEAYALVNKINQTFVDLVRASGGNNAGRHLLIAGYHTDFARTLDPLFQMPDDPANRCILKVHYYDPFGFTHLTRDESWARMRTEWGTDADIRNLNRDFDRIKERFHDNGIPVIIGEYGMASEKPLEYERKYTAAVTEAALVRGFAPMLWCVQRNAGRGERLFYFDRHTRKLADPLLEARFKELAQTHRAGEPPPPPLYSDIGTVSAEQLEDIIYVTGQGLFQGSGGRFNPFDRITNMQFITVLSRMANPGIADGNPWYQPHLDWAADIGIAGFDRDAYLTRDDMALWFYKYAAGSGIAPEVVNAGTPAFTDIGGLSAEHQEAIAAMYKWGVTRGTTPGVVFGLGNAERVQIASIFARFHRTNIA